MVRPLSGRLAAKLRRVVFLSVAEHERTNRVEPRKKCRSQGGPPMTGFVSQLSIVVAYAAMAFVGAIVLGVL